MRSRWLSLIAAGLAFVACGTTGDGASETTTTSSTESTSTSTSSTTSTTTTSTTTAPSGLVLTQQGLGPLRIGMATDEAVSTGLVGAFTDGCPLVDPPPQTAPLLQPAQGSVETNAGVVTSITITGGGVATSPGGVTPGDPLDEAVDAWQTAGLQTTIDRSTAETFGVWFVAVDDVDGPAFGTTAEPADETIGPITAPHVVACE